jgi:hypothetical protein
MTVLIAFILSSFGLTHIIVAGKIFDQIRDYIIINYPLIGDLITCYQCTGFWVGVSLSFCFTDLPIIPFHIGFLIYGFLASGTSSFLSILTSAINRIGRT